MNVIARMFFFSALKENKSKIKFYYASAWKKVYIHDTHILDVCVSVNNKQTNSKFADSFLLLWYAVFLRHNTDIELQSEVTLTLEMSI